jgi:hypothetical protein
MRDNSVGTISDARLRHLASRIHALGERPLFELLRQLDAGTDLHPTLEAYARLPAEFIRMRRQPGEYCRHGTGPDRGAPKTVALGPGQ